MPGVQRVVGLDSRRRLTPSAASRRQVKGGGDDVAAKEGAADPRRSKPPRRKGDQEVLHARSHRNEKHRVLSLGAPRVGVQVPAVGYQAGNDQQRSVPKKLAAADAFVDGLLAEAVTAKICPPLHGHRVHERDPSQWVFHQHETPGSRVMRSGSSNGVSNCGHHIDRVNWFPTERTHGTS